jgi:UDP:flavonoid glycosyltransferase YjiC (YdhE family)
VAYVLGADEKTRSRLQALGLTVSAELVDIRKALAGADLCVTHGMGTTLAALSAGVPLLMLPKQLENYLIATALQRIGAGIVVPPDEADPDFGTALGKVLGDGAYTRGAQALAARYCEPSVGTIGKQAVARIEALAAGSNGGRA